MKFRVSRPDKPQDPNRVIPDGVQLISFKQATSILEDHFKEKSWNKMMSEENVRESSTLQNVEKFISKELYLAPNWPSTSNYHITRHVTNFGRFGSYFQKRGFNRHLIECQCHIIDSPIHRIFECELYEDIRKKHQNLYRQFNLNSLPEILGNNSFEFGKLLYDLSSRHWELFPS